ncbi:ribonuclease HI [Ichthyobacterium seriolicida]|uniref:ribonuclease H n=1 Tax=Ichthyobacterium seriolicida TaxID=242600 RepID=A0A1J1EAI0_9FLAO|nr:ribonuclease HI [Ichthyobacterium seriolicida]BAV94520.1 ribonuclease HI [Ichthyobacterium seriolicida]
MSKVNVYTDGAAKGNPGVGGFGIIMELEGSNHSKELYEGYSMTTNNRMELLAVIVALEELKKEGTEVVVYTDSKYVVDSVVKKWVFNWEKIEFKGRKNSDLWKRFLLAYRKQKVQFKWIKGHNNHPKNERCDELASLATKKNELKTDTFYEEKK